MYLDIAIAKLIEADHSNNIDEKDDLLSYLKQYEHKSEILKNFIFLDNIKSENKYTNFDDYLKYNQNNVNSLVQNLINDMSINDLNTGLNRNSIYISNNGTISTQLPSHYKFDRAVASLLNIHPLSVDKNTLIVPKYSNTIRIYLEFAVLEYKPNIEQILSFEKLNIKKYCIKDHIVDNVFDPLVDNLPIFKVYK